MRKELIGLTEHLDDPGVVRHIALMPGQAHFFMIPKRGEVTRVFPILSRWLMKSLEQRYGAGTVKQG